MWRNLALMVMGDTFVTMNKPDKRGTEQKIPAGEFKARCLALLDEVANKGRVLVVTKRGRPVARIVPLTRPESLEGSVLYEAEDAWDPIEVTWDAMS